MFVTVDSDSRCDNFYLKNLITSKETTSLRNGRGRIGHDQTKGK